MAADVVRDVATDVVTDVATDVVRDVATDVVTDVADGLLVGGRVGGGWVADNRVETGFLQETRFLCMSLTRKALSTSSSSWKWCLMEAEDRLLLPNIIKLHLNFILSSYEFYIIFIRTL